MTLLGALFFLGFALSCFWGRKGLLVVMAAAVPFNDSAMLVAGSVTVSPFYFGLIVYVLLSARLLLAAPKSSRINGKPGTGGGLLLLLFVYAAIVAFFGPRLFQGMGVIASGIGLDEQVGVLSPLVPSMSNLAQVAYLGLALLLVHFNELDRQVTMKSLNIAFTTGVAVAGLALACKLFGLHWPTEFFDNSPRGFYALPTNPRLRGQFSEPSHLGAFTVAASLFFITSALQTRDRFQALVRGLLAALSVALLVASASGTAVIGGLVAVAILASGFISRSGLLRTKISPSTVVLCLAGMIGAVLAIPALTRLVTNLIDDKQGGISYQNRGLANEIALGVFRDSWGFGVGIGSNRASSLFVMLLSTVGIVGTCLFVAILLRSASFKADARGMLPAAVALVGCISAAFISVADLASPTMWILVAATYRIYIPSRAELTNEPQTVHLSDKGSAAEA